MEAKKLMAGLIVGMMIMSGLAFVNVVTGSSEPNPEPKSVPRCVLLEDFTEWKCPYCPARTGAIVDLLEGTPGYGYDVVAPLFYHVWWPGGDDPMYFYNTAEVVTRANYYGVPSYGVPETFYDGHDLGQDAAIKAHVDSRLAIPSPISITSSGFIDDIGLTGEISAHFEAADDITDTDLVVHFGLWEHNITRYPGGNEASYPWVLRDMIPTAAGTPIWTSGATAGESVDITYPFIIESDWIVDEIGISIWVQDVSSKDVKQAHVEAFDNYAPMVDLVNPDPDLDEQVLSGTIPVTWSATDNEEEASNLDISIDYSPNSGNTWINIMSGTDNNVPPYTYNWISPTVSDGIEYMLRVTAEDSGAKSAQATSLLPFSIDNIQNDEWFFQVDTTAALKDLNMRPVEQSMNLALTSPVTVAGEYQVGAWQTTQTFPSNNINGAWTFRAYGKVPHPGVVPLQGYLYAKVFSSSNMATPLATTSLDNENVGTFPTSHLFTWTSTLAGSISPGDSLVVEIWLNAVGGPYIGAYGSTVNPGFDSGSTPWTFYAWKNVSTGTYMASGGNPGGYVNITLPKWTPPAGSKIVAGYWQQTFTTGFAPTQALLSFDYKYTLGTSIANLYVFVDTTAGNPTIGTEVWSVAVNAVTPWISIGPLDISSYVNADTTYYLKIAFYHGIAASNQYPCVAGYDNVLLTYANPYPWFEMEYDFTSSKSSVLPTIGIVTNPPYAINCVGKPANSWVYVSFPITISGNIQTILNDATLGDGATTWTVAKWYNPQTPLDPWKTYRAGSTVNDLTTINNAMGVWLWITANGGDQMLTTGLTGSYSASPVAVSLHTGWNMVGYPSATSRAESATLPAEADFVAVWQAATPYITQHAKGAAMMAAGNAYWVHVTADCTWTVNP